jgi:two-component system, response regulator / RNA-binding antiterminator
MPPVLKVLLVDEAPGRAATVRALLAAIPGVELACTLDAAHALPGSVAEHRPHIILVDSRSPRAEVLDGLAAISAGTAGPLVLFTFEAHVALRVELEEARLRLDERKLVERAKGVLMKHRGIAEDEAYAALRSLAMERGIRMGEAAKQVIDIARLLR